MERAYLFLFNILYRRKLRKFRSRSSSHYVIHETETTNGSTQSYDSAGHPRKSDGHIAPIYRSFVQDGIETWQRTRPLPVPACRPTRIETGSVNECDVDHVDDDVIAMTPLTTASDLPLLTPTAANEPNTPLFNITTSGPTSTDCHGNGSDYPDAVRSFVAASTQQQRRHCDGIYQLAPCQQQQPIDVNQLQQHSLAAVYGPPETGYERCNFGVGSMRPSSAHNVNAVGKRKGVGGPYYFKLDLTAGLNGGSGSNDAPTSSVEHGDVTTPCLMCLQQQQQQQQCSRTGTMQRRRVDSHSQDYSPVHCHESLRY